MKRLIALGMVAGLGACAQITAVENGLKVATGTNVTPTQVYLAAEGYAAAEASAQTFLQLPLCPTGTPVCRTQVGSSAVADAIWTARAPVEAMVKAAGGTGGVAPVPVSVYNAAVVVITNLQSAISTYNPKGE